ncbi:MAG TPA: MBL fold metallo-hydrolase [Actinomycetota bacterium]|nr:MBL fold metallo-hydrolase [Actinomycetota bacterium]
MAYEVIVLGGSGTFPAPGAACSGYLLRSGETALWVDCGPGSFANLQRHIKPSELRAIVLTHTHLDHIVDLYPFLYQLRYGPEASEPGGFPVYAPAGAAEFVGRIASNEGPSGDPTFGGYLSFLPINATLIATVGDFELRFCRTRHPVETYALRATANSRAVAYTADTGPDMGVTNFCWGANLIICEATSQKAKNEVPDVHMTAAEAGELATRACTSQLLLTHLVPGLDPAVSREQAAREFRGEIDVASDNLRILVY